MKIEEFRKKYEKEFPVYVNWAIQIYEKFGLKQIYANSTSWITNWQDYEIEEYKMPNISSIEELVEYCYEFDSWQYPYESVTIKISESKTIDSSLIYWS